jgi:hypothetical protein
MTDTSMSIETFERLALIHGGDIAAWPAASIAPARDFMAVSAQARAALADAAALDAALDALVHADPAPAPEALSARILADADGVLAARRPQSATGLRPTFGRARWVAPAALAASAMIGVFMGWSAPSDLAAPFVTTAAESAWEGEGFLSADLMAGDDPFAAQ